MSTLSDLQDALVARAAEYKAMIAKPSYDVDGQDVKHTENRISLLKEISELRILIAQEEGPFEHQTEVLF